MIVDIHCHHIQNPIPEDADFLTLLADLMGFHKPKEEVADWWTANTTGIGVYDKFVRRMDEAGIDKSVLFYSDSTNNGYGDDKILHINQAISKVAERHPNRIIPFASIDPRRPQAPELFRRCIQEYGMKGLKWHPDNGFYPNSEEAFKVLEVASELKVPLITHTGPLPGMASKYAHPIHLDDVACCFSKLKIIAAHMGDTWWRDWLSIVQYKRNIYGDLAEWQFHAVKNLPRFKVILREILDSVGCEQVLFGSDAPCFEPFISNRAWVDTIKSLSEGSGDCLFTRCEVEAILGGNAAKILGV